MNKIHAIVCDHEIDEPMWEGPLGDGMLIKLQVGEDQIEVWGEEGDITLMLANNSIHRRRSLFVSLEEPAKIRVFPYFKENE